MEVQAVHSYAVCLGAWPEDIRADLAAFLGNVCSSMIQTGTTRNVLREENLTGF